MPIMDGIEATKEIRRLERLQAQGTAFVGTPSSEGNSTPSPSSESKSSSGGHTPVKSSVIIVALTASSLQSDRVAALAAGCNDFLTKPVSLQWLNNKIIEWGSIKALQMWADLRPEVMRNITSGRMSQARNVASRLHVPEHRREMGRSASAPRVTQGSSIAIRQEASDIAETPEASVPAPMERRAGSDMIVNTLSFVENSKRLALPSGSSASSGSSGQSFGTRVAIAL